MNKILTGLALLPIVLMTGCGDEAPDNQPVADTPITDHSAPVISGLKLENTNSAVPLAAVLRLTTDEPARISININDGRQEWIVTPGDRYDTDHVLPVLGLRPERVHTITVIATDEAGNATESAALSIETPPVPVEMPNFTVTVSDTDRIEPGVTMLNVKGWNDGTELVFGLIVMVNNEGEVVWYYYTPDNGIEDVKRLSNGNLLYDNGPGGKIWELIEIDMLGNIVQRWHGTGSGMEAAEGSTLVDLDTFHHDVLEIPNGNFLTISSKPRVIEDFPTSDSDPDAPTGTATLIGDVIAEFSRDGTVIRSWELLDILDPYRIGYDSLSGGFWMEAYGDSQEWPLRDWGHANALVYDATDDTVLMSLRHQDALVKIDLSTGKLVWILGTHDNWKEPWSQYLLEPEGDLEWPYHTHGPALTPQGDIVLFDNGTHRATPYKEKMPVAESYSRAVEFAVDETAMTVSQTWSYGGPGEEVGDEHFYSRYLSDTDWLPQTGNILITDGARETNKDGVAVPQSEARLWARIVEVTHDDPAEKVFELIVEQDEGRGVHIYRAEKLPSLYP